MNIIDEDICIKNCSRIGIRQIEGKGRGVFAMESIQNASVIEVAPLLLVPKDELSGSKLREYYFKYKRDRTLGAIALGYASLYNHAFDSNARFLVKKDRVVITAKKNIEEGEEICINYRWKPKKYLERGILSKEEEGSHMQLSL